jgi:phosphate-selective porin OprO and OprP
MTKLRFVLLLVLVAAMNMRVYSQATPENTVEQRLQRLEDRLSQLESRLASVKVPEGEPPADNRLEALDQKLRILERNRELEQEQLVDKKKDTPVVSAGADGFSLRSADKAFQLKFAGHIQADSRSFYEDSQHTGVDSFVLRRVRPIISGTIFKFVDFNLVPDFAEGKVVLQDAYLDLRYYPKATFRAGKFKPPVGLERLQADVDTLFVERALPTNLVPQRDQGVQVWGEIANVNYAVGVFNGAADGAMIDNDTNDGKDVAARIFATPFAKTAGHPLQGLGFGASVSSGRQEGAVLPSFKSSGQATFFNYSGSIAAAGRHLRYSPQAYFYYGPFGVLGEYVQSNQEVAKGALSRVIANHAWQLSTSYFLTGEKNGFKHGPPRRNFEGLSGGNGIGAWELLARYSDLAIDHGAFTGGFADITKSATSAETWSVGVNWYLNRYTKLMFDYDQTHFNRGAVIGNRPNEKALLNRLQLSF